MAKRGRPKLPVELRAPDMPIISLRLNQSEYDQVERLAQQHGQSRSHFMRSIVRDALATQKKNQEVSNG